MIGDMLVFFLSDTKRLRYGGTVVEGVCDATDGRGSGGLSPAKQKRNFDPWVDPWLVCTGEMGRHQPLYAMVPKFSSRNIPSWKRERKLKTGDANHTLSLQASGSVNRRTTGVTVTWNSSTKIQNLPNPLRWANNIQVTFAKSCSQYECMHVCAWSSTFIVCPTICLEACSKLDDPMQLVDKLTTRSWMEMAPQWRDRSSLQACRIGSREFSQHDCFPWTQQTCCVPFSTFLGICDIHVLYNNTTKEDRRGKKQGNAHVREG